MQNQTSKNIFYAFLISLNINCFLILQLYTLDQKVKELNLEILKLNEQLIILTEKQNDVLALNKTMLEIANKESLLLDSLPWLDIFKAILCALTCYYMYQRIQSFWYVGLVDLLYKTPLLKNFIIKVEEIQFTDSLYDYLIEIKAKEVSKILIKELGSEKYTDIGYYICEKLLEKSCINNNTIQSGSELNQLIEKGTDALTNLL